MRWVNYGDNSESEQRAVVDAVVTVAEAECASFPTTWTTKKLVRELGKSTRVKMSTQYMIFERSDGIRGVYGGGVEDRGGGVNQK